MADVSKEVRVAFEGDDRLSKTIEGLNTKFQGFSSSVADVTQPLADLTEKILLVEAALTALAVGGLVYATNEAGKFGDSFNEISTLIDAPADAINTFRQDIIDYARDSTQSIENINESLYQAISAGTDYTNAIEVLGDAERLAIATKGDLSTTIQLLAQTVNALGSDQVSASEAADFYFTTIKSGVTRIDELAGSIGKVLPIAKALDVDLGTISAAMVALTKSGLETSEAVTSLTSLFTAFVKPTSQASQIAEKLGIQFGANTVKSMGFEEALKYVYNAANGNVEVLSRLIGRKEALTAALILGADAGGVFTNALNDMENAAGSTVRAYAKMAENFSLINQNLVNNIKATLIEIGTPLLDDWQYLAQSIGFIFQGLSISFGEGTFDPLFEKIEEIAQSIADQLNIMSETLPEALALLDWDEFLRSIDNVIESLVGLFEAFFGEIDVSKPEDLAKALQKGVDAFTALNNVVSGILEGFKPFVEYLAKIVDGLINTDEKTQKAAGNLLAYGTAVNKISGLVNEFSGALDLGSKALAVMAGGSAFNTIINLFNSMGVSLVSVVGYMGQFAAGAAAFGAGWAFGTWLSTNIPLVKNFGTAMADVVLQYQGLDEKTIQAIESQAAQTKAMGDAAVAAVRLGEELGLIPAEKTTEVKVKDIDERIADIDAFIEAFTVIPEEKETEIIVAADENQVRQEWNKIYEVTEDGVLVELAVAGIPKAKADVDDLMKEIPPEKQVELLLAFDKDIALAEIEATAEVAQAALKFKAEVDIAEIESMTEIMVSSADMLSSAFESSGNVIIAAIGGLSELGALAQLELFEIIEEEMRIRKQLAEQEIKLSDAQIAYLEARTAAMEKGEALINITMDGIYPELELVMWKIIEQVQIKASEEGLEFLVGI